MVHVRVPGGPVQVGRKSLGIPVLVQPNPVSVRKVPLRLDPEMVDLASHLREVKRPPYLILQATSASEEGAKPWYTKWFVGEREGAVATEGGGMGTLFFTRISSERFRESFLCGKEQLSRGEMSLLRAIHNVPVAVKVARLDLGELPYRLLRNEIEILQRLGRRAVDQGRIIKLYGSVAQAGEVAMFMEYIQGGTLCDALKNRRFSIVEALHLFESMVHAVRDVHEEGVSHNDLKPANIMLEGGEKVKLIDFGLACLFNATLDTLSSSKGSIMGTPEYMSPEQAMGEPLGAGSDIYSLGVILYEMLTGSLPIERSSPIALLTAKMNNQIEPLPESIPPFVRELVSNMLQLAPEHRYQNCAEVLEALTYVRNLVVQIPESYLVPPLPEPVLSQVPQEEALPPSVPSYSPAAPTIRMLPAAAPPRFPVMQLLRLGVARLMAAAFS